MELKEAVIVAFGRSAVGKAPRGTLKDTRPEDLASTVVKAVLNKVPQLNPADIDDVMLGCAFGEAEQGANIARQIAIASGIPETVSGQTVNRFCASGLQAIAMAANSIMAGQNKIVLCGGVECMSVVPMGGNMESLWVNQDIRMSTRMGITAENIADKYGFTREELDAFALDSHRKAVEAQDKGLFDEEIIPVNAVKYKKDKDGKVVKYTVPFTKDEGVRRGLTMETLGKLRPVFKKNGKVTAGNASQMNDCCSVVILMEKQKALELGLKPIAKFVSFAVAGCAPDYMGLGPIYAIPKALEIAGLKKDDIDVWELNEAFASQALACIKDLDLDYEKVNPIGGGISLGHPLGATGAFLTCKLLQELKRRGQKYGVVSMCIGGGMGAAGVYEMCD